MYRMPESSGTQPQFVASDKHDTAGEHYDHRLLEVQSISGGGVQTTPASDDEDGAHTVQMAGLEKSCSSSSMCYCCRWTIRYGQLHHSLSGCKYKLYWHKKIYRKQQKNITNLNHGEKQGTNHTNSQNLINKTIFQ